jgi:hypothetical protein
LNPEFTRNAWLELTPLRVWALPLVVLALAVLANAFGHHDASSGIDWGSLHTLGLGLFSIFTVWGAHKALQSVTGEVAAGTWDMQRLAQHRPWELLVGKLVGSTVFEWLGIGYGLLLVVVASAFQGLGGRLLLDVVTLVLAAAWLQSLAVFVSLAAATGLRTTRRPGQGARQSGSLVGLVLLSLWIGPGLFRVLASSEAGATPLAWWWTMPVGVFVPLTIAMFLGWTLLGAHRLVRAELQEPVSPLPWIGFLVFLVLYAFPFVPATVVAQLKSPAVPFLGLAAVAWGALFYPVLLAERKDVVRLRGLVAAWHRGDARSVWTRLPLWTFNVAFYVLAALALGVCALVWPADEPRAVFAVAASCGLFLLRDLGWILAVHLAPNPGRRPDLVVWFFLAVLYGLLPLLLATLGEAGSPAMSLVVPAWPVLRAIKEAPASMLLPVVWALPGLVVAWAFAVPRLVRALVPSPTADPRA